MPVLRIAESSEERQGDVERSRPELTETGADDTSAHDPAPNTSPWQHGTMATRHRGNMSPWQHVTMTTSDNQSRHYTRTLLLSVCPCLSVSIWVLLAVVQVLSGHYIYRNVSIRRMADVQPWRNCNDADCSTRVYRATRRSSPLTIRSNDRHDAIYFQVDLDAICHPCSSCRLMYNMSSMVRPYCVYGDVLVVYNIPVQIKVYIWQFYLETLDNHLTVAR